MCLGSVVLQVRDSRGDHISIVVLAKAGNFGGPNAIAPIQPLEVQSRGIMVDNLEAVVLEGVELEVVKVVLLRGVVKVVLEPEEVKFTQSLGKKLTILRKW
ncbi:hypothetical protein LIER_28550 [Lithospermum erythrorhizon]|uniref:RNA-binding protein n=1 Tax=Lithospermum erythrorhizon TaxID=34254 RepID=A0AAV3RJG1_LITER